MKSTKVKQMEAQERLAQWQAMTVDQRIAALDADGFRATKQRARLVPLPTIATEVIMETIKEQRALKNKQWAEQKAKRRAANKGYEIKKETDK
jgi:hypothetical protein